MTEDQTELNRMNDLCNPLQLPEASTLRSIPKTLWNSRLNPEVGANLILGLILGDETQQLRHILPPIGECMEAFIGGAAEWHRLAVHGGGLFAADAWESIETPSYPPLQTPSPYPPLRDRASWQKALERMGVSQLILSLDSPRNAVESALLQAIHCNRWSGAAWRGLALCMLKGETDDTKTKPFLSSGGSPTTKHVRLDAADDLLLHDPTTWKVKGKPLTGAVDAFSVELWLDPYGQDPSIWERLSSELKEAEMLVPDVIDRFRGNTSTTEHRDFPRRTTKVDLMAVATRSVQAQYFLLQTDACASRSWRWTNVEHALAVIGALQNRKLSDKIFPPPTVGGVVLGPLECGLAALDCLSAQKERCARGWPLDNLCNSREKPDDQTCVMIYLSMVEAARDEATKGVPERSVARLFQQRTMKESLGQSTADEGDRSAIAMPTSYTAEQVVKALEEHVDSDPPLRFDCVIQ